MLKYYFVKEDETIFVNLPKSVQRSTIALLKSDIGAKSVYIVVSGVNLILDLN